MLANDDSNIAKAEEYLANFILASGYKEKVVELGGIEPPTSCMPCKRSPS